MEDRQANLARMYLDEFLHERGYTWHSVHALPPETAKKILIEASTYASTRLAEVETRAHMVDEIHGATQTHTME